MHFPLPSCPTSAFHCPFSPLGSYHSVQALTRFKRAPGLFFLPMTVSDGVNTHASFAPTLDQLDSLHSCLLHFSVRSQTPVHTATLLPQNCMKHISRFLRNSSLQVWDEGKQDRESLQQSSVQRHPLSIPSSYFQGYSERFRNFPWNFTNSTLWSHNPLCHLEFVLLGPQLKLSFIDSITSVFYY